MKIEDLRQLAEGRLREALMKESGTGLALMVWLLGEGVKQAADRQLLECHKLKRVIERIKEILKEDWEAEKKLSEIEAVIEEEGV